LFLLPVLEMNKHSVSSFTHIVYSSILLSFWTFSPKVCFVVQWSFTLETRLFSTDPAYF